jgi:magnesium-transporting ATPase (P-type)
MTIGEKLRLDLSKGIGRNTEARSVKSVAASAAKETTVLYRDLKGLFLVLSSFIALIGAFRVYRKFNLEEDGLGKTAAIWFSSALTVFILGSIVELFVF